MDLFDSSRDFTEIFLKSRDPFANRERNTPTFIPQKELILQLTRKLLTDRPISNNSKENSLSQYDERLVDHLKKNGGWNHQSKIMWQKQGFDLKTASNRLQNLQKSGLMSGDFETTPKFDLAFKEYKEKGKERQIRRVHFFRQLRKQSSLCLFQSLAPSQQKVIEILGSFRQTTPKQANMLGASPLDLKSLQEKGIVDLHNILCDQRPMQLYSLTKNNGRNPSGKDLAHYGAGIYKPATGIQRDHSKILHDVSVIDAVREAKGIFTSRGYQHLATFSEHQMYQTKTSANTDMNHRYADAYLTVKSPGGDDETVAIEFGNYAPSYLKEKMAGIDADHRMVFTHDANRAEEYRQILADLPGSEIEVHVIPTPHMEVER